MQLSQEAEPPAGGGEDSRKRSLRGRGVCSRRRGEEVRERPCPSQVQLAQMHHLLSAKAPCWCPQAESVTRSAVFSNNGTSLPHFQFGTIHIRCVGFSLQHQAMQLPQVCGSP